MDHQKADKPSWLLRFSSGLTWPALGLLLLQLALVIGVASLYNIEEGRGFLRVMPLVAGGFVVHALLPLRFRQPFFLVLSLAAFTFLLGLKQAVGLFGLGLGLIGLCHLPIARSYRIALLLGAALLLGMLRTEWIVTSWESLPTLILPILGAIFMFRLIIYVYDLQHERPSVSIWTRLSYFFMLPNVSFLLFPVIDYKTFQRTYYDQAPGQIYQKGISWMFRGITHLLLYRAIYYYWVPSPSDIEGLGGVVSAMVATYLLYLRVSGQFHLIIGLLGLFGYNLPETHHHYFLASGFTDLWRRINIYWKDFMVKIFYYPVFMRMRGLGLTQAIVGATVVVFVATWFLHSYQWFWLRGSFFLTTPDTLFWVILGIFVIINSLYELKRGRTRSLEPKGWQAKAALWKSLSVVGTFVTMCVLWSLWTSPTMEEWFVMLAAVESSGWDEWLLLLMGLMVLVGGGVLYQYLASRPWGWVEGLAQPSVRRSATYTVSLALVLVVLGRPEVQERSDAPWMGVVASLQEAQFNQRDQDLLDRGYYEGLMTSGNFTSQLWEANLEKPRGWANLEQSGLVEQTEDLYQYALMPSHEGLFKEVVVKTNRWGMRDEEYPQQKPAATHRMAVMGASYEMGSGVRAEDGFVERLEAWLNEAYAGQAFSRYEVLNFAVGGYSAIQHEALLDEKVLAFDPDVVMVAGHSGDAGRASYLLAKMIKQGLPLPQQLVTIATTAGVDAGMPLSEIQRRFRAAGTGMELVRASYAAIVARCREVGVVPVWLFVPRTGGMRREEHPGAIIQAAKEAGFIVMDLRGAYGEVDPRMIQLAPWDEHPNARGHALLATRLAALVRAQAAALGIVPAGSS